MKEILVSVIIPVYQMEAYLERCVNSVLLQNFSQYEIVLVNDGSTDASVMICDDYAAKYHHISVIHKENGGLSEARNVGIQQSRGKYVFFLDSDDWIIPTMLEELADIIRLDRYDVIGFKSQMCYAEHAEPEEQPLNQGVLSGKEAFENMLRCRSITSFVTDKLFRRTLFIDNDVRFPTGAYYEDLGIVYKLLLFSNQVFYINRVYYYYFLGNDNSITKTWSEKKFADMYQFYKEIYQVSLAVFKDNPMLPKKYYSNGLIYLLMKLYEYNQENTDIYWYIKDALERNNLPIRYLKGYPNHLKYICYRLRILRLVVKFKIKLNKR